MATRDEWSKRVQRWRDSGLTAGEYAAETGINLGSLRHWSYVLGRDTRRQGAPAPARRLEVSKAQAPKSAAPAIALPLVELTGVPSHGAERFELELRGGQRLHIPASFEAAGLRRLLEVLEAA